MKRVKLVVMSALALTLLVSVYAQSRRSIEVTNRTIASQRGKPYVIDLRRKGTTYTVKADLASQVRIRTADDEIAMNDLMKRLGVTSNRFRTETKFLVGTLSDLRAMHFGRPTRTSSTATARGLTCGSIVCECDPDVEGDCDARKFFCTGPTLCFPCQGPDCPPELQERWTCFCFRPV